MIGNWRISDRWSVLSLLALVCTQCVGVSNQASLPDTLDCSGDLPATDQGVLSPSGQEKIVFIENRMLSIMDPDGGNLIRVAEDVINFETAPDGRRLVYRLDSGRQFIYTIGSQEHQDIKAADGTTWSPDGNCLVL